tara:strand:- start:325 stop:570 length:246 start_codon:yes stop_codon:yes gene_type:complete
MKLNNLLNFKMLKKISILILCIYIIYNIYHGVNKYNESFKLEDESGIINVEKITKKMENKIEQYENLIDKLDNINTDLKSM